MSPLQHCSSSSQDAAHSKCKVNDFWRSKVSVHKWMLVACPYVQHTGQDWSPSRNSWSDSCPNRMFSSRLPHLLVLTPWCDAFSWVWARPRGILLMNRTQRKQWKSLPWWRYRLRLLSLALSCLLSLLALMKQAATLQRLVWQRTEGGFCQQPARNWILPTATWVSRADPSLTKPECDHDPSQPVIPGLQKLWDKKIWISSSHWVRGC
jgi:hypothetical protein